MTEDPSSPRDPGPPGDRVPPEALAAAKAAFGSRVEGEIAQLAFDSLLDGTGTAEDHTLTFEHPEVTIHLKVFARDDSFRLNGLVYGDQALAVVLHIHDGDTSIPAEPVGSSFQFDDVRHGQMRVELGYGPDKPAIWTDWFLL